MMLLAVPFGLAIGLVVGGIGGGGAILALPVLVYVLGEPVGPASAASLVVVALAAAVGAGSVARQGQVCWRIALAFAPPAAAGSLVGALASARVSAAGLILAFVPVMLAAALATWRRAAASRPPGVPGCPTPRPLQIAVAGAAVGLLTGFFGVGGGFAIVPVLTVLFGFGFRRAAATSLVVIFITGIAALASHLFTGAVIDVPVTASLAAATAGGALLGTSVAGRVPQQAIGRAFAFVVTAVAVFLLVDVLAFGGPPGG